MRVEDSAVYSSRFATVVTHSRYLGYTIVKSTSWITRNSRWYADTMSADTLFELKNRIREAKGLSRLYPRYRGRY